MRMTSDNGRHCVYLFAFQFSSSFFFLIVCSSIFFRSMPQNSISSSSKVSLVFFN